MIFQSTLPHGSDQAELLYLSVCYHFNPRSLTGATSTLRCSCHGSEDFNPRSLTGATTYVGTYYKRKADFNPRSLTGATYCWFEFTRQNKISIHAPSRERRHVRPIQASTWVIFQSTLPHGSDQAELLYLSVCYHFNPRSLTGATSTLRCSCHGSEDFNPRSLTGATQSHTLRLGDDLFQSTLPHGSDNNFMQCCKLFQHFNPRSLTGATYPAEKIVHINIFQSTLPHGSDWAQGFQFCLCRHFNPRSLTGATP